MAEGKAFYLTSVAAGLVLAHSPNGNPSGVVAQNEGDQDQAQKWTVEYGDQPDTIALRCCGNGEYLHANGGDCWATVGTGAKQWWKTSKEGVTPPHACRLSPVEYPRVYLNHFQGLRVPIGHPGMKVHMWVWEPPNEFCLSWYFMDAAGGFNPQGTASAGDKAKTKEVKAQQEALQQREAALEKREQATSAQTAELDKLKDQLEADRAELAKQKDTANNTTQPSWNDDQDQADLQRKLDELRAAERNLASKEAALDKKQQQSKANENNLKQRERQVADAEPNLKARQAALDKQSRHNKAKEAEIRQREAQLASAPTNSGPTEAELLKAENENLKLQLRIVELEDQLNRNGIAPKSSESRPTKNMPVGNGHAARQPPANGTTGVNKGANGSSALNNGSPYHTIEHHHGEPEHPVSFSCGHTVYPPPRKLRRRMIGILYE